MTTNWIFDDIKKLFLRFVDVMIVLWFCLNKEILSFSYAEIVNGKDDMSGFGSE